MAGARGIPLGRADVARAPIPQFHVRRRTLWPETWVLAASGQHPRGPFHRPQPWVNDAPIQRVRAGVPISSRWRNYSKLKNVTICSMVC